MCGRDQEHLGVRDVPGIFKKSTLGVTTKADIATEEVLECIRVEDRKKMEKARN